MPETTSLTDSRVDDVQTGTTHDSSVIDLVVQRYRSSKIIGVYIRPFFPEIEKDVLNHERYSTYMFKRVSVETLKARVMPQLSVIGPMPVDERSSKMARALLQNKKEHEKRGVVQLIYDGRKEHDLEKAIETLNKGSFK